MVNEGFKILDEDMAQRPTDLDIVYVYGFGFPPYKGGPMHWANNELGLDVLLEGLKKYDAQAKKMKADNPNYFYHDYFVPNKLLVECVTKKKSLAQVWKEREKAQSSNM